MNTQTQSSKLAKNVSGIVIARPMQVLLPRIGTLTSQWRRYPSMVQFRGFHIANNTKPMRGFNTMHQKVIQNNHQFKQWQLKNYENYSVQMRLALRGYYRY